MIDKLGFKKGSIVETIVTTYNEDRSPNAAPMGVYASREEEILLKVHLGCDTYSNILRNKGCVVNLIFDPLLFLRTTLLGRGKGGAEPELKESEVGKARTVDAPFIKSSHAYLEAQLKSHRAHRKTDDHRVSRVSRIRCAVARVSVQKEHPIGFNRGLGAAVELAIKLSRNQKEGCEEYLGIMKRTMAKKDYDKIHAFLIPYIH